MECSKAQQRRLRLPNDADAASKASLGVNDKVAIAIARSDSHGPLTGASASVYESTQRMPSTSRRRPKSAGASFLQQTRLIRGSSSYRDVQVIAAWYFVSIVVSSSDSVTGIALYVAVCTFFVRKD